jgi:hypothetical protein
LEHEKQGEAHYARRLNGPRPDMAGYWIKPLLAYASIIVAPILSLLFDTRTGGVTDPSGAVWQLHDIRGGDALVDLFTVLPFWLLAVFRSVARVGE